MSRANLHPRARYLILANIRMIRMMARDGRYPLSGRSAIKQAQQQLVDLRRIRVQA